MPEESIDIVRRAYDPASRGVFDTDLLSALAAYVTADTEFDFSEVYPDGTVLRGLDEARRLVSNWPWGKLHFEPERFIDVDGVRVLVFVLATATGVGSGVPVARRTAHECTFKDGLLVRFKVYPDRDAALEATGASR
jgi:ketosteroid isomerase-like protein